MTGTTRPVPKVASAVLIALAGAALAAVTVYAWPRTGAAVLRPAERLQAAGVAAVIALPIAFWSALVAGARSRLGALLLPAAVAGVLAHLPASGELRVEVSQTSLLLPLALVLVTPWLLRWRGRVWTAALGIWTLGAWAVDLPHPHHAPPRSARDLVLITIDTFRSDPLDFCPPDDGPAPETPNLDALARESRFTCDGFASVPLTGPSHAGILSGSDPVATGLSANGLALPPGLPWVPALLRAAGWHTRAYVSAATLDASLGYNRGFDHFDSAFQDRLARGNPVFGLLGYRPWAGTAARRPDADTIALALADDVGRPSFTWIHLYGLHWPYTPSLAAARRQGLDDATPLAGEAEGMLTVPKAAPPARLARGRALYRAQYETIDAELGELLAHLPRDARVVVVGDHGESLGEQGYAFAHGRYPQAAGARVPILLRVPGLPPGRLPGPVPVEAVAPTLLELAGLDIPGSMTARSLLGPPAESTTTLAFASGGFGGIAVRDATRTAAKGRWTPLCTYDRTVDPLEVHPRPADPADPLVRLLGAEEARARARFTARGVMPAGERAALRALGYF